MVHDLSTCPDRVVVSVVCNTAHSAHVHQTDGLRPAFYSVYSWKVLGVCHVVAIVPAVVCGRTRWFYMEGWMETMYLSTVCLLLP